MESTKSKILNLELYRDGGSFAFEFENVKYECKNNLFLLEIVTGLNIENKLQKDSIVIKRIIDAFMLQLKKDVEFNKIMNGRVEELKRYSRTLAAMRESFEK